MGVLVSSGLDAREAFRDRGDYGFACCWEFTGDKELEPKFNADLRLPLLSTKGERKVLTLAWDTGDNF